MLTKKYKEKIQQIFVERVEDLLEELSEDWEGTIEDHHLSPEEVEYLNSLTVNVQYREEK